MVFAWFFKSFWRARFLLVVSVDLKSVAYIEADEWLPDAFGFSKSLLKNYFWLGVSVKNLKNKIENENQNLKEKPHKFGKNLLKDLGIYRAKIEQLAESLLSENPEFYQQIQSKTQDIFAWNQAEIAKETNQNIRLSIEVLREKVAEIEKHFEPLTRGAVAIDRQPIEITAEQKSRTKGHP